MMNTRTAVAGEVRAAIARAGINQTKLADQLPISRAGLSARLAGHRPFTTDDLEAIGQVLEVDPLDFLLPRPAAAQVSA